MPDEQPAPRAAVVATEIAAAADRLFVLTSDNRVFARRGDPGDPGGWLEVLEPELESD